MKKIFFLLFACCALRAFTQPPAYKNKNLSPKQRAKDLLSRMTLDEKLMRTHCIWLQKAQVLDGNGNFNEAQASLLFKNSLGRIARLSEKKNPKPDGFLPKQQAQVYNKTQIFFIEETSLGIPVMIHEESLHGQQTLDATNFPIKCLQLVRSLPYHPEARGICA